MTGAAGGMAGGLWAIYGAALIPGAAWVLDAVGFEDRLSKTDAVVTGEDASIGRPSKESCLVRSRRGGAERASPYMLW